MINPTHLCLGFTYFLACLFFRSRPRARLSCGCLASVFFASLLFLGVTSSLSVIKFANPIDPIKHDQRSATSFIPSQLFTQNHLTAIMALGKWWKKKEKGSKKMAHRDDANAGKENVANPENAPPESALAMPSAEHEPAKVENVAPVQQQDESEAADEHVSYHGEEMWA